MQTTPNGWKIIDEQAGVLSYSYKFAAEGQSNCFTAKLPSGGLMIISPPSRVSAAVIDDLAEFGEVEAIVANNGFHHLGLAAWHERFPKAGCYAAEAAIARIAKKSKDAPKLEPLSALRPRLGDSVAVVEVPTGKGETWAWAKIAGGYAWYASDILANMPSLPSAFVVRMLFKLSKSAPGYRVFGLALKFLVKDKRAGLSGMLDDVREHPPRVMVPAHGEILEGDSLARDTEQILQAAV